MIILDTNVISTVMQLEPTVNVINWLDTQPENSIWTSAITVFEIEFGLRRLPDGKRRQYLETAFTKMIEEDLEGRVLPFDAQAALEAAAISVALQANGKTVEIRDVQIAGIAQAYNAVVATRNVKDFESTCRVVNPWEKS